MIVRVLLTVLTVTKITYGIPLKADGDEPVDLHYFCTHVNGNKESQSKIPIILLHDAAMSLDHWRGFQQVIALETGRRVCALDLRNHGDSPWNDRITIKIMLKDLDHFLDQQNMQKAILIGHGLGGMVAAQYALAYPSRVNSFVVEDMRPGVLSFESIMIYEQLWSLLNVIEEVPLGATVEEARKAVAGAINKELKEKYKIEELDENTTKNLPITCPAGESEPCKWKTNIDGMSQAIKRDDTFWDGYEDKIYHGPALFIYGTNSPMKVASVDDYIEEFYDNLQLVGIKGAGHNLHGVHQQFNDEVLAFLKKHESEKF